LQLVLSVGDQVDPKQIGPVPKNAVIVKKAPQLELLKQTSVCSLDKLTADHLSTLLNEVLNDFTYRDNARKLQRAIVEANGLSVAADFVEESLGATERKTSNEYH
jgi:zeaxanthin glucosyltransferase